MRNVRIKLISFASIILLNACSSFLEEETLSIITEEDFFTTADEAENALNAVYSNFTSDGVYGADYWHLVSLASDEGVYQGTDPNLRSLSNFNYGSGNDIIQKVWNSFYSGISACNIVIAKVPQIEMGVGRQSVIMGEAYFFRGLFYSELYRLFRSVPLVLDDIFDYNEIPNATQASTTELIDQITNDLNAAIQNLPSASDPGMPNGLAARSILARINYFNADYAQASADAGAVIDSAQHSLIFDINNVFRNGNESNSETIFAVTRSNNNAGNINVDLLPASLGGTGSFSLSSTIVDLYDSADRRADAFIHLEEGVNYSSKYWDETNESTGGQTTVDFPLIRYADILLMYADAQNEINNGPTTEAYNAVNMVRARARQAIVADTVQMRAVLPDLTGLDYAMFKEAVDQERRKELLWEGNRWMDLVRSDNLLPAVNIAKPFANVQSRNLIFPIPDDEISANGWQQNDGY